LLPTPWALFAALVVAAQSAGMVTWICAIAGAAITASIAAEANPVATTLFTLLNGTSFRRFPTTLASTEPNRSWIITTSCANFREILFYYFLVGCCHSGGKLAFFQWVNADQTYS
jgi:predicted membrane channel-forming protein YqfA (hemolysin III family)